MSGELFSTMAGVTLLHAPCKFRPLLVLDLVARHVDMIFANTSTVSAHVRSARLRALGVSSLQREAIFPELPTIAEIGLHGFEVDVWLSIFVPAGTPAPVVARISRDICSALAHEDVARHFNALNFKARTPRALATLLRSEIAKWTEFVRVSAAMADCVALRPPHPILIPASLTTLRQRSMSALHIEANSAGVLCGGSMPSEV